MVARASRSACSDRFVGQALRLPVLKWQGRRGDRRPYNLFAGSMPLDETMQIDLVWGI
jgi:hypothetical protein